MLVEEEEEEIWTAIDSEPVPRTAVEVPRQTLPCAPSSTTTSVVTFGGSAAIYSPVLELRSRTLPSRSSHAMTDATTSQPASLPATVVCAGVPRQRDPPIFSGTAEHDVEDWLSSYERVSTLNKWDNQSKLAHVSFYLADVAKLWFFNHEAAITSWSAFKQLFTDAFDRPAVRQLRAEQRLRQRAQQPGETFPSYIEDVLDLCRRVNPTMTEDDKIKHILKGIEDGAFQMLLAKSPTTVSVLVNLCQSFDELRRQRSLARQNVPQPDSISGIAVSNGQQGQCSLSTEIKDFIREEVARQLSLLPHSQPPPATPLPSPLQQAIRTGICEAIPPIPTPLPPPVSVPTSYADYPNHPPPMPLSYAAVVTRSPQRTASFSAPPLPAPIPVHTPSPQFYRPPGMWRTQDNRPICFNCGVAGHVARFCRRRVPAIPPDFGTATYAPPHAATSSPSPRNFEADPRSDTRRFPSPRRRSPSPMRRRAPTDEGN